MTKNLETKIQLVTFTVAKEEYAVDILKVQEINRIKEVTKLPKTLPYIEGVINLRGKIISIINLRKIFKLPEKEDKILQEIVIMNIQGATIGLMVDAISGVLRISANMIEPPPTIIRSKTGNFISGVVKLEDKLIIVLDMDKLIEKEKIQDMVTMIEKAGVEK